MVATKLANMEHGGNRRASDQGANLHLDIERKPAAVTVSQAAEMLNVSERSVKTARTVQEQGAPELVAAVDAGKISVSAASIIAKRPEPEQQKIVQTGAL